MAAPAPSDSGIYKMCYYLVSASIVCSLPLVLQVSAWGGYVFIINLVPLHVFVLLLMGRFSNRYVIGGGGG